jgi:hypothetical protein
MVLGILLTPFQFKSGLPYIISFNYFIVVHDAFLNDGMSNLSNSIPVIEKDSTNKELKTVMITVSHTDQFA